MDAVVFSKLYVYFPSTGRYTFPHNYLLPIDHLDIYAYDWLFSVSGFTCCCMCILSGGACGICLRTMSQLIGVREVITLIINFQIFTYVMIVISITPCIIPYMCHNNVSCYTGIDRRMYREVYTDLSYLHVHMYVAVCGGLSCVRSQLLICRKSCVFMFVLLTYNWQRG